MKISLWLEQKAFDDRIVQTELLKQHLYQFYHNNYRSAFLRFKILPSRVSTVAQQALLSWVPVQVPPAPLLIQLAAYGLSKQ